MAKTNNGNSSRKKVFSNADKNNLLDEAKFVAVANLTKSIEESLRRVKLSQKQVKLNQLLKEKEVTSCIGPAGTSKTFSALFAALEYLVANPKNSKIILCKPIVEAGEKLGFLPGEKDDKIDPYLQSYLDLIEEFCGKQVSRQLFESGRIVFEPVAYMRGKNLKDCFVIVDESQNYTMKQLMTIVTRKNSSAKMMFCGDYWQADSEKIEASNTDFEKFVEFIIKPNNKIGHFRFDRADIKRDKMIIDILDNYEAFEKMQKK